MTIVCYDGETLAADKMARVRKSNGVRKVSSLTKEKITGGFTKAQFEGEPILLVGRSGLTKLSTAVITYLKTHKTVTRLPQYLNKQFPDGVRRGCSILILTHSAVHRVKITETFEIRSRRYDRTKKLALGKHYRHAEFLMQVLGSSAVETVQVVQAFYDGCGGGVDSSTRLQSCMDDPVTHVPPIENKSDGLKRFRKHVKYQLAHGSVRFDL